MIIPRLKTQQGFTLMEVMVAVSIFTIIVTVGIGSLLTINNAYRKSQTQRQAIDSLTYVLESMSRRIRTAQEWSPNNITNQPTSRFEFIDQDGVLVTYQWVGEKIIMFIDNQGNAPIALPDNTDEGYDLTPENVHIATDDPDGVSIPGGLSFVINGGNGAAEYVQINIGGYVVNGKEMSNFSFQTGVSKRSL